MATTPVVWDSFNTYNTASEVVGHFTTTGTTAINQDAARSRTGNGSIVLVGGSGGTSGATMSHAGISSDYVVVNAAYYVGATPTSIARSFLELQVGSSVKARVIVNTDGTLRIDVGTTEVAVSTAGVTVGEVNYLEFVYYSHATSGLWSIYLDGVEVVSFTGNTVGASGSVESVLFRSMSASTSTTAAARSNISDVVIATVTGTPTVAEARLGAVAHTVIVPTSDITTNGTPSSGSDNFAMVDDVPNDGDATYVELAAPNDADLYGHTSSIPSGTTPLGVAVFSAQRLPSGGTTQVRHIINDGSTTETGADLGVGGGFGVAASFWDESPFGTPSAWTVGAVESLRFGVEARP